MTSHDRDFDSREFEADLGRATNPFDRILIRERYRDVDGLIAELGSTESFGPLGVRGLAARSLGRMRSVEALPALKKLLADESADVRVTVVRAISAIGGPVARSALAAAAEDDSELVRGWAMHELAKEKAKRRVNVADRKFFPRLRAQGICAHWPRISQLKRILDGLLRR